MPDLYIKDPEPIRVKRRSFRIEIDNPMGQDKTVCYHQEDAYVNALDQKQTSTMAPSLRTPFMEVATTLYSLNDPVTGQDITISGAAIAIWIELDYIARSQAEMDSKKASKLSGGSK